MSVELSAPNLEILLPLNPYAPRAARYHVAHVGRTSPDLRDAVVLLTSELVTRAVERCHSGGEELELRVWMTPDVVRVEVGAPRALLGRHHTPEGRFEPDWDVPDLDGLVFAQVADRWSIGGDDEEEIVMWFEIDRHVSPVHSGV